MSLKASLPNKWNSSRNKSSNPATAPPAVASALPSGTPTVPGAPAVPGTPSTGNPAVPSTPPTGTPTVPGTNPPAPSPSSGSPSLDQYPDNSKEKTDKPDAKLGAADGADGAKAVGKAVAEKAATTVGEDVAGEGLMDTAALGVGATALAPEAALLAGGGLAAKGAELAYKHIKGDKGPKAKAKL
jgi:hypothetical protein